MIVKSRERKYKPKTIPDDSKKRLEDNWRVANCDDVWQENEPDANIVSWKNKT